MSAAEEQKNTSEADGAGTLEPPETAHVEMEEPKAEESEAVEAEDSADEGEDEASEADEEAEESESN